MNDPGKKENAAAAARVAHEAAAWVLRADRGLTPAEQDAFSEWLAADPRHSAELARHRRQWGRLDALGQWRPEHGGEPNADLLAPPPARRLLRFAPFVALAAAALIAVVFFMRRDGTSTPAAEPRARVLADGTAVELNRDAAIAEEFSATERRVRLERGEAHFAVTKDPARPFVVSAGGVEVRAVGTAFNVRVAAAAVEVLVTEGVVRLETPASAAPLVPALGARQRAVVARTASAAAPQIATLTAGEIERVLAWQHRLLHFNAAPLREIVAEFNRRNAVQLAVGDAELGEARITAAFRSDNVAGFVALLEAGFGARAEHRGENEIVLRRAGR